MRCASCGGNGGHPRPRMDEPVCDGCVADELDIARANEAAAEDFWGLDPIEEDS